MTGKCEKKVIRSLAEFEKEYFPKMVEIREEEEIEKTSRIGLVWADEIMKKVKKIISER